METVHIDGSTGEGGGQVLRTSLSLAAILGCEVTITNVRADRDKPGLSAQHVTCVRAAAAVCDGDVDGDEMRSTTVHVRAGEVSGGEYEFDVASVRPSAGSTGLVLQTVLPVLLFAERPATVVVKGGTNVRWSPCYEYLKQVFVPAVGRMGGRAELRRDRGGWYPKGGGQITCNVRPVDDVLGRLKLDHRGDMRKLTIISTVSEDLPDHIVRRQAESAMEQLPGSAADRGETVYDRPSGGTGTCLTIAAHFAEGYGGASALGERGKPAETVGAEAASKFNKFLDTNAAVDRHLADQLLLYAALAEGETVLVAEKDTGHLRTNAVIIGEFTDADITFDGQSPVTIRVMGIGYKSR